MKMDLKGRSFLTLKDFSKEEIQFLIQLAVELKRKKKENIYEKNLRGKNVALIFEKPSTRTRCSFAVACNDEGAYHEYLSSNEIQLGHKESVEDTARVLGRIFDAIEFRGFSQKTVELLAQYSGVPVYNGLTDEDHPTQVLADLMTIQEVFAKTDSIKLVFVGDGRNNMSNALMIGAAKMGMDYAIAAPSALWPDTKLIEECAGFCKISGGKISVSDDISKAILNADVIYTDVWYSMGEEDKKAERLALLNNYQVDAAMMAQTQKDTTIFMHCLPAVKGDEVTEEVFESKASVVFDQAENRMHTIKAVMVATM